MEKKKFNNGFKIFDTSAPIKDDREFAIAGYTLRHLDKAEEILSVVAPEDFLDERLQLLYGAIETIIKNGQKLTAEQVKKIGSIPNGFYDPIQWDAPIYDFKETLDNAQNIHDAALKRKIKEFLEREAKPYFTESDTTAAQLVDLISKKLSEIEVGNSDEYLKSFAEVSKEFAESLKNSGGNIVKTGVDGLDGILQIEKGNLVILSARTGMGKTTLALQIMLNLVLTSKRAIYFSIEMSALDLYRRILVNHSGECLPNIESGNVANRRKFEGDYKELSQIQSWFYDKPNLRTIDIKNQIRRVRAENGELHAVFVDYLGLMSTGEGERFKEIGKITRELKQMAREFNIVIFLLVQVNRNPEARAIKTPQLSDLRDSGSVEQDADAVIFIHRPHLLAVKVWEEKRAKAFSEGKKAPEKPQFNVLREPTQLIIAKNRRGTTGSINILFNPSLYRFWSEVNIETIEFKD